MRLTFKYRTVIAGSSLKVPSGILSSKLLLRRRSYNHGSFPKVPGGMLSLVSQLLFK